MEILFSNPFPTLAEGKLYTTRLHGIKCGYGCLSKLDRSLEDEYVV